MDITRLSAVTMSPPMMPAPAEAASFHIPEISWSATSAGVSAGQPSPTSNAVGIAPMAATSAMFTAAALRPTCSGVDQSSRKCTFSTSTSVVS